MYNRAYGIIETLAPLHIGASAGEETGNLNLIFRDQFTQTGIIPGSSIRGRFRADMRSKRQFWLESQLKAYGIEIPDAPEIKEASADSEEKTIARIDWLEDQFNKIKRDTEELPKNFDENHWYGHHAVAGQIDGGTTEALVKFEYTSLVWLPVFCPGQPVVWISCPRLLKRYKKVTGTSAAVPEPYTAATTLIGRPLGTGQTVLFFNLGFLQIDNEVKPEELTPWIPPGTNLNPDDLVVVGDNDIAMLHDMALYRQSRVRLEDDQKKAAGGAFFNVEAIPEGSVLIFPIALKVKSLSDWLPFAIRDSEEHTQELYFGGLESIGFGRCQVTLQEVKA